MTKASVSLYLGEPRMDGTGCCRESATSNMRALSFIAKGTASSCPLLNRLGLPGLADPRGLPKGSVGWLEEGS